MASGSVKLGQNVYDRESYIIIGPPLPACRTNFDTLIKKAGKVFDIKPVQANSALFIDYLHVARISDTFISERIAEELLSRDNNLK